MRTWFPLLLPVIAALLFYATGLTQTLGAHPWWAVTVIWIGLCLGVLLAAILWRLHLPQRLRGIVLLVLTLGAFATAYIGKARFAASYAEDAMAGQMWYFGWMATCTFVFALLASVVWPNRQHH